MMIYLLIVVLVGLAVFRAPLFTVLLSAAMLGFFLQEIPLSAIAIEIYRLADMPLLMALPFFAFAGYLMAHSHTSRRLVNLAQVFLGWMPGGLAIVALVACALFTAFTGASGVTIVALGALLYPALRQDGYHDKFSLGLVTTSGSLGLLFPPSVPLIIYGVIAQQMSVGMAFSMTDLFLAGLLPGILMVMLLSGWSLWTNRHKRRKPYHFSKGRALKALRASAWELPLPIFIIAGIYGGLLAVSEAAVVSAVYVLIVEVFIYKEIRIGQLPALMSGSMMMVGGILLILGVSLAFTNVLIDAEVPSRLFHLIQGHIQNKIVFLILLNLLLLILGAVLDIFSALVIMVPLILPVAVGYGISPIHLGVIFLANMQIGYFTPPVGMNLFISSYSFDKPVAEIYKATLPFMAVLLLALVCITYWPVLSLVFTGELLT